MKKKYISNEQEAIPLLEGYVELFRQTNNAMGFFAAVYYKVAIVLVEALRKGFFTHTATLQRLHIIFVNRYVNAVETFLDGFPSPLSWQCCNKAARELRSLVSAHIYLGMNAHIGFDLPVALVEACREQQQELHEIEADFHRVIDLLAPITFQIDDVLHKLTPFRLKYIEAQAINKLMLFGRVLSWEEALALNKYHGADFEQAQQQLDRYIATLGEKMICYYQLLDPLAPHLAPGKSRISIGDKIEMLHHVQPGTPSVRQFISPP